MFASVRRAPPKRDLEGRYAVLFLAAGCISLASLAFYEHFYVSMPLQRQIAQLRLAGGSGSDVVKDCPPASGDNSKEVGELQKKLDDALKQLDKANVASKQMKGRQRYGPLETLFDLDIEDVKSMEGQVKQWRANLKFDYIGPVRKRDCSHSIFQDIYVRLHRLLYKVYLLPLDQNMGWNRGIYPMDREYLDQVFMPEAAKKATGARCLEWGTQYMSRDPWAPICKEPFTLTYDRNPCGGKFGRFTDSEHVDNRPFHGSSATDGFCADIQDAGPDVIPSDFFDTVICTQVFEHLPKPWLAAAEIYRITKPGGYLVFSAPSVEVYHANPGDFYRFTVEGAKSILEQSGFCVIKAVPTSNIAVTTGWLLGFGVPDFTQEEHHTVDPLAPHTVAVLAYKSKAGEACPRYEGVEMQIVADCWRGIHQRSTCIDAESKYQWPGPPWYDVPDLIKKNVTRDFCHLGVCPDGKKPTP